MPTEELFKGRFKSGYTDRTPRVTEISSADAYAPIRLGPGWNESWVAFHAYEEYRNAGPMRSLKETAKQVGRPVERIERWSRQWQWSWRVAIYDFEQHKLNGTPISRAQFMARQRKIAKWGFDKRYWTREGRRRLNKDFYWMERHAATLWRMAGVARWEIENGSKG